MNLTQQRFYGFQKTPFLWLGEFFGLTQFQLSDEFISIDQKVDDTIRLGNYVERLVSFQLARTANIEILKENIQIIQDKTTLGEIDCILRDQHRPIHLEIAYKFYLYDPTVGNTFLEHWIGPNRRDSLLLKLNKIQNKQFPLLYNKACKKTIKSLNVNLTNIKQRTFFKAQLYLPYSSEIKFKYLNSKCIAGFYVNNKELPVFKNCKFYIPNKLDWLIEPHCQVDWINFMSAKERIKEFHKKNAAPLCWLKHPSGEIDKLFVVRWKS